MKTCVCTLPYYNPNACGNCSNNDNQLKSYEYKPVIVKGICLHLGENKEYYKGGYIKTGSNLYGLIGE